MVAVAPSVRWYSFFVWLFVLLPILVKEVRLLVVTKQIEPWLTFPNKHPSFYGLLVFLAGFIKSSSPSGPSWRLCGTKVPLSSFLLMRCFRLMDGALGVEGKPEMGPVNQSRRTNKFSDQRSRDRYQGPGQRQTQGSQAGGVAMRRRAAGQGGPRGRVNLQVKACGAGSCKQTGTKDKQGPSSREGNTKQWTRGIWRVYTRPNCLWRTLAAKFGCPFRLQ